MNKILLKGDKILDLGCRDGIFNTKEDQEIVGVDIVNKELPHYNKFIQHNLDTGLPKNIGFFDMVIAKDILEHLYKPIDLLKEIHSIMIEDGILMVKVPDYRSKNAWEDYTHIRPYNKGSICQLLTDSGFKVEKVVRLGGYFFPKLINQGFSWLVIGRKYNDDC